MGNVVKILNPKGIFMSENETDPELIVDEDHDVPGDLLSLHVELEEAGITAEEFKKVYGK